MNINTFKTTAPGSGNLSFFVSSSNNINYCLAATVALSDCGFRNTQAAFDQVNNITFTMNSVDYSIPVTNSTLVNNNHYYLEFNQFVIDTGSFNTVCNQISLSPAYSTFIFDNSDYNAVYNNATTVVESSFSYEVDRNSSQANPTNLQAILNGTADPANIQDSNYSDSGWTRARYDGTKLNSGSLKYDDPAVVLRPFQASLHESGSAASSIRAIQYADLNLQTLYFTPVWGGQDFQSSNATSPSVGARIYKFENNRYVRLQSIKFYMPDSNIIGVIDSGTSTRVPWYQTSE